MPGLGQLPIRTIMRGEKTVRRAAGRTRLWDAPSFSGYEIHMGETLYENGAEPLRRSCGKASSSRLRMARSLRQDESGGLTSTGSSTTMLSATGSWISLARHADSRRRESHVCVTAERQARIDRWAGHLRQSLDMKLIREMGRAV